MSDEATYKFQEAAEAVKRLSKPPDNETMLKLYGLFKQATAGECSGARPGIMDFVGRAKHDAWKALAGTSREEAMRRYVALVESLIAADR
jgi:acyl-CoA-binding protein